VCVCVWWVCWFNWISCSSYVPAAWNLKSQGLYSVVIQPLYSKSRLQWCLPAPSGRKRRRVASFRNTYFESWDTDTAGSAEELLPSGTHILKAETLIQPGATVRYYFLPLLFAFRLLGKITSYVRNWYVVCTWLVRKSFISAFYRNASGEDYITRNLMTCTHHQILFG
jgi:hypothetical protein